MCVCIALDLTLKKIIDCTNKAIDLAMFQSIAKKYFNNMRTVGSSNVKQCRHSPLPLPLLWGITLYFYNKWCRIHSASNL